MASALPVIAHQPFGDAAWLLASFALYGGRVGGFHSLRQVPDRLEHDARAHARTGANRRREPNAIQAVIDCHAKAPHLERLPHEAAQQRKCEKSMRNSRPI